jgi:hypothetical protein
VACHLRQPPWGVDGPGARAIGESAVYRLPSSSPAAAKDDKESKTVAWVEFGEWVRAFNG